MNGLLAQALVLAVAGYVVYANAGRALLCLAPGSFKTDADAPAGGAPLPGQLSKLAAALAALGFVPIGSRFEKAPLSRATLAYDFAHPGERAFATLFVGKRGKRCLYFLSRLEQGALVLTANYRRPAREVPGRYSCGALEDVAADRLFKAHQRRVASLGTPQGRFDQEGRLEIARAWAEGPGRAEIRLQNVHGLLWSLGSLGMVGAAIFGNR